MPSNRDPSKKVLNVILIVFLLGSFFSFGFFLGDKKKSEGSFKDLIIPGKTEGANDNSDVNLDLFWKVYGIITNRYINQEIDVNSLVYGAIKGMVDALEDPHSFFMSPEETNSFQRSLGGVYEGIGAYIGLTDDVVTIDALIATSPAEKAGVKAGDKILKIDDKSTEGLSLDEASSLLRGERGSKVNVTIFREGESDLLEIEITRDKVDVPSLEWEEIESSIYHIKLSRFEDKSYEEMTQALDTILKDDTEAKIILDLRNNPGGFFDQSINLVGIFAGSGQVAVVEEDGQGFTKEYKTEVKGLAENVPMVILINEASASASEIVAGALRDLRGIKLIGKKSYGKGSVQEYKRDLGDGSSLKLTVARWLTPNKTVIDGEGLSPDIEVDIDREIDGDEQLDQALLEIQSL